MKKHDITIWKATSAAPAAPLRVALIRSNLTEHVCRLTHGATCVRVDPEAEPLIDYARAEFGARDEKFAD